MRQKLPDALEDGSVCSNVASVLDGAEDVLSIFFTNSALRKVKTDKVKRKQMILKAKHDCNSTDIATANTVAFSEQKAADQETDRLLSPPPLKAGDIGTTQWSPLSLSEIPLFSVGTDCCNSPAKEAERISRTPEQLQSDFNCGQLVRPQMKVRNNEFTKKKRKFVYTVETSKLQVLSEDPLSQKTELPSGIPDSGKTFSGV